MNSLALMNWMEVKIDQIRGKLNSLQVFPLTTWLTSILLAIVQSSKFTMCLTFEC